MSKEHKLLSPEDPTVFTHTPGTIPGLFISADHAGSHIPKTLNNLDCNVDFSSLHFGCDIGIAKMAKELKKQGAEILTKNISRAVIDPNRTEHDSMLIPSIQDGITIPANTNISEENKQRRIHEIYRPYHKKLKECIDRHRTLNPQTLYIAVHSMEKKLEVNSMGKKTDGKTRPQIAILVQNPDFPLVLAMKDFLEKNGIDTIGINDPYIPDPYPIFLWHRPHLPSLIVEFRNDLLRNDKDIKHHATLLLKTFQHIKINHPELLIARRAPKLTSQKHQGNTSQTGT